MSENPLYPNPIPGKHPVWARAIAFEHTKTVVGVMSALLLAASIAYGLCRINKPTFDADKKEIKLSVSVIDGNNVSNRVLQAQEESRSLSGWGKHKVGILLFWIVAPPIWFWFEYVGLYRYDAEEKREKLEQFKYTQDVASKIWLALVTALTILYFSKDLRG